MNEDRLRSALRQARVKVDDPDAWDGVRTRARRIHRHRRVAQSAVALVVVVAAALGALAAGGAFDADADRSIIATPSEQQGEIVVAFDDRIVVMTTDGEIVRTVLDGLDLVGNISVSPDGEYVYFAHQEMCNDQSTRTPRLARLPVSGGTPESLGLAAFNPLVNPDGRRVAYEFEEECSGGARHFLGITDLVTGGHERPLDADHVGYVAPHHIEPLSWSPDGARLLYRLQQDPGGEPRVNGFGGNAATVWSENVQAGGYASDGTLVLASSEGVVGPAADASGSVIHEPEPRYEARGPAIAHFAFEPGSDRLLVRLVDGTLQMQRGSDQPRPIATGVQGAAWLPRANTPPTPTTSVASTTAPSVPAPAGVPVALRKNGELVRIHSVDSWSLVTRIAPLPLDEWEITPAGQQIAVTPDGATIYAERATGPPRACPDYFLPFDSEIVAIDTTTRGQTAIARGSFPAVSPDGRKLAYARWECRVPPEPGQLVVRDLTTGDERAFDLVASDGSGAFWPSSPLAFAPDSKHVVARHGTRNLVETFDTEAHAGEIEGQQVVDPNSNFSLAYLGETGDFVGATSGADSAVVVAVFDAETGESATLIDLSSIGVGPGIPVRVVDSDPSGRHLLILVGGSMLYRWSVGDAAPTFLADEVVAAAWQS